MFCLKYNYPMKIAENISPSNMKGINGKCFFFVISEKNIANRREDINSTMGNTYDGNIGINGVNGLHGKSNANAHIAFVSAARISFDR